VSSSANPVVVASILVPKLLQAQGRSTPMLYSKLRAGRPPCFRTPRRGCSHLFLAFARARARARACFYAFRMQNLSEAVSMGRLGRGVCYIQNTTNQVLFKRCGALRCVAVRCGVVWRGVAWCGAAPVWSGVYGQSWWCCTKHEKSRFVFKRQWRWWRIHGTRPRNRVNVLLPRYIE